MTKSIKPEWMHGIDKAVAKLAQYWRKDSGCAADLNEVKAYLEAQLTAPAQTAQAIRDAFMDGVGMATGMGATATPAVIAAANAYAAAQTAPSDGTRHKVPCIANATTICPQPAYCHSNGCKTAQTAPAHNREADRQRYPDPNFNRWLDESVSDCYTVWDAVGDIAAAWAGWENRPFYAAPAAVPVNAEALPAECKRVAHNAIHDAIYKIDDCDPVKDAVRDALDSIDLSEYAAPVAAAEPAKRHAPLLDAFLAAAEQAGVTHLKLPAWDDEPAAAAPAPGNKTITLGDMPEIGAYHQGIKDTLSAVQSAIAAAAPAAVPEGWKLVPIEPTERMIIDGFESVPSPNPTFTPMHVWDEYEEMSGCQQAAFRAKLCWAAMLAAAPETWKELPSQAASTGEPKQEPVSPYKNQNEGSSS